MSSQVESYSLPPAVRRVASDFRLVGVISFWTQLVLAIVSTLVLLFAIFSFNTRSNGGNPGTGAGLFLVICGLVALYVGAYWAFSYIRLSKRLRTADPRNRPKPKDATQALRLGLIINLAGMLLTILGGEAIIGALLAKSLAQPQGGAIFAERLTQFVQPLDIFVVQANINIILAHFCGVVGSIWLIWRVNRQ
ncbi:MAG: DUF3611 family protein [Leptolyngbyaceae cyanobacterium SL_7_1]|nr:DUF3611 family protein [Leptolyngbyaceae cyanobacterium SL_7_1]